MGKRGRNTDWLGNKTNPAMVGHNWEGHQKYRFFPEDQRYLSSISGTQILDPAQERRAPKTLGSENQ